MATTTTRRREARQAGASRLALAVADANWYTTENLFRELHRPDVSTLLLTCIDYVNAWRRGARPWSWGWGRDLTRCGPDLWRRDLVLPSGWMKRFPRWGMRPIRRSIADWRARHAPETRLALVMTYPHYLYLRDQVRPDLLVYFNVDDYALYWPHCAREIDLLERQAVRESDLTICVSHLRAEQLRAAEPAAAHKVRHLPHGAPSCSLEPASAGQSISASVPADLVHLPRPLLGYVGSLEDRIDWRLLNQLSLAFPHASIVLIGRPTPPPSPESPDGWYADSLLCQARPNVHVLGWRPQEAITAYNRAFDACLIPYRVDHPFNRACCPTKIMDYMATGRPIVSTALPECQLYGHLFDVAATADEFLSAVSSLQSSGFDDGRSPARLAWAHSHSCRRVADRLLDWLPS